MKRLTAYPYGCTLLLFAALATGLPGVVCAATTDLADAPLAGSSTTLIKPNIMYILDDSGSMTWDYMPNAVSGNSSSNCYKNNFRNKVYYNPNFTYTPPPTGDGSTFLSNASFTAARSNGFDSGSGTTNLTGRTYYKHTNADDPADGLCHLNSHYTSVTVNATSGPGSTDEKQNYANWYSYFRTRLLLMKSATGKAFIGLGDTYRIGFVTINPGSSVTASKFLPIKDFDAIQKQTWFDLLYGQTASGGTPLRSALARVGRHFAGRADGINVGMGAQDGATGKLTGATDPVQYSCQQNFAILTTDGYWGSESNPTKIDGSTAIGSQDSAPAITPRPLYDGATGSTTTITTKIETERYDGAACPVGEQQVVLDTDTTVRSIVVAPSGTTDDNPGVTSSDSNPATTCSVAPRALQVPNPRTIGPDTAGGATAGGANNTLADVAQYYYATDLRVAGAQGADLTAPNGTIYRNDVGTDNNVPKTGSGVEDDKAAHQHMTTFTLGLGVPGSLIYKTDYKTATTGDFNDLRQGTKNWPAPTTDLKKSDDLWHAAVNGRGLYFSASDPDAVATSLSKALAGVSARVGSAAAASTSTQEPVSGDNFVYVATYQTQKWDGDVQSREINILDGTVGTTAVWSARTKLNTMAFDACDKRTIYTFTTDTTTYGADKLKDFAWDSKGCNGSNAPTGTALTTLTTAEKAYFETASVSNLSQYASMSGAQQTAAVGANLVNYLRGWRGNEGWDGTSTLVTDLYRTRDHLLGDIVSAEPLYVRKPPFSYTDTGYAAFQSASNSSNSGNGRTPMLYIGANDGMLHALYAGESVADTNGGVERWAYIPSMVMPNLFVLADSDYKNKHRYFVDGSPRVGDVYIGAVWKTIVVGGLNKGGKGYYALDVTDPASPKALWEFKHSTTCYAAATPSTHYADCHLGFTYGNPVITKLSNGTWVVIVSSGYNNVNSPTITGDGLGYLYVLDAADGKILSKIATTAGNAATPSGLAKIVGWVNNGNIDNTSLRVYGGDLLGNVWRFDINDVLAPVGKDAFLLATLVDAAGISQPITTRPTLANVNSVPTVYVATGSYLGTTDLASTQTQTIYAIKDTQISAATTPVTITGLRTGTLIKQTLVNTTDVNGADVRTVSCTASCSATGGWFADLPISKERVNVNPRLLSGTLIVASNIPEGGVCVAGGYSYLNYLNYKTGSYVTGQTTAGVKAANALAVGLSFIKIGDKTSGLLSTDQGDPKQFNPLIEEIPITGKRVSWRELLPE